MRKAKTPRQHLANAVILTNNGEDGALYLQQVCTLDQLKRFKPRTHEKWEIIQDAITYKQALTKRN